MIKLVAVRLKETINLLIYLNTVATTIHKGARQLKLITYVKLNKVVMDLDFWEKRRANMVWKVG